ncbi:hypothetical protein GUJ93_ZPchr0008g12011 [Zizania palustris]|uniref:Uncharacterized protein n=1 Tax=Zizania palustris TaxID=103762 RepID=A0A8J5RYS3_ZIZPA|nr:hypothetical protein GUJ93_ZPchr0008g12011 [Zizania palustris]
MRILDVIDVVKEADPRRSALDELMEEEDKMKERSNRKDYWLCPVIIVKVMSKSLVVIIVKVMSKSLVETGYYKQKGVVKLRG